MNGKYLGQIDVLKGLMILCVLIMHSLPLNLIPYPLYWGFIIQAVPIFILIFGFNNASSLSRKKGHNYIYNKYYFRKLKRFLIPFAFAVLISLIAGIAFRLKTGETILRLNRYLVFGRLPLPGPGNYFVSLLFQFSITMPIIFWFYKKKTYFFLLVSLIICGLFELYRVKYPLGMADYLLNFYRFLPAVIIGMILANKYILIIRKSFFIYLGSATSLIYQLFLISQVKVSLYFLSFLYPAFLLLLALKHIPQNSNNVFYKLLVSLGRSSYHIFLIQIIYFSFIRIENTSLSVVLFYSLLSTLACIGFGKVFNLFTNNFLKMAFYNA